MMCIKTVCYRGPLAVVWLIYDMTRQIQTKIIGSRGRGLILLLTFILTIYPYLLFCHVTRQNNHPTPPLQTAQQTIQHTNTVMLFSTFLRVLVASAASIPFVAAEFTSDQFNAQISSTSAPPGYNDEGGSVFNNFVNALNDRQFFLIQAMSAVFEKPATEPVQATTFNWCSDLTFSDLSNSSTMGYTGRCVEKWLVGYDEVLTAGGPMGGFFLEGQFGATNSISAVFVKQQNAFEGQFHGNSGNDVVVRYWDDGSKTSPTIGWEGPDQGSTNPDAAETSWSAFGDFTWVSVEEVAQLFNTSVDEFTPEKFNQVYVDTWIKEHEDEAAVFNPNPDAELEIVDEVKNETNSAGETMSPAQPDTEEDGGTDASAPVEEDDSAGNGRKLASVAARFVSAALRVFGI
jgi:hypothetical protein